MVGTALLVAAGCYAGALADVWLTFPQVGAAVLFPSYAVLLTAFLVSEPKHWWIYLVASSIGNYLPHRDGGASPSFVVLTEGANYARALVAAIGMRWLGWGRDGLSGLRGMSVLMTFAVGLGPAVGALLGAAVVMNKGVSADFLTVWEEWFMSNALTALTGVPLLLSVVGRLRGKARPVPPAWVVEVSLATLGLFAAGGLVFAMPNADLSGIPTRMYWPLPFLLWAAVRFTPVGTSAFLLLVAGLSIWGAVHGLGPFVADTPTRNLLHLQLFLIVLSVPLLLLAALVQKAQRTTEELHASREQYRAVVEDQTEMICRFLPDGTFTFVNTAFAAFHGRDRNAFVGRNMRDLLPPDALLAIERRIAAVTREQPLVTQEIEVGDSGAQPRWQQWRDRGLFDGQGRVLEYQCVGRDVTDRVRAENERQQLDAQKGIERVLRENDRRKDEFLAMLGHELRNPLAPFGSALELLDTEGLSNDDMAFARGILKRQFGHMTRLVDDLLDISRVKRGAIELRLEQLDVRAVVAQVIEATRPSLEAKQHASLVRLSEAPLLVRGDATRLAQMIGNLLSNAVKYTEPGGRIEISAVRDGAHAVISVRDNGIGIPEGMLDAIFELFAQAENRGETRRDGLGIGLTLARQLAALHGGEVVAKSPGPGQGSEFVIRLPSLDAESLEAVTAGASPQVMSAPHARILVVDDNVDAAESIVAMLRIWGHTARGVHDGHEAVEVFATFAPHLILLDLDLPGLDGFEVARRVRYAPGGAEVMLVALTGLGQAQHRVRSREAGFDDHFVKPIDNSVLRDLLVRSERIAERPA